MKAVAYLGVRGRRGSGLDHKYSSRRMSLYSPYSRHFVERDWLSRHAMGWNGGSQPCLRVVGINYLCLNEFPQT